MIQIRFLSFACNWGWALQGDSGVEHSRETLGLGTPGVSKVGLSRETLGLGTPGRRWALQENSGIGASGVGHSMESLGLGTPGRL